MRSLLSLDWNYGLFYIVDEFYITAVYMVVHYMFEGGLIEIFWYMQASWDRDTTQ